MKNPTYKGAICWNKHSMGSLFGLDGNGGLRPRQKRDWEKNAEADWIISEGVHEPLVSVETWNAAQDAARKRATLGGKARPTNRSWSECVGSVRKCRGAWGWVMVLGGVWGFCGGLRILSVSRASALRLRAPALSIPQNMVERVGPPPSQRAIGIRCKLKVLPAIQPLRGPDSSHRFSA
jgi:hypothetical protein